MRNHKRCNRCLGSKQVIGMGLLIKTCEVCGGRGVLEVFEDITNDDNSSNKTEPHNSCSDPVYDSNLPSKTNNESVKKKPGRPRKGD